ncbi:hypothetical protein RhiirA4_420369 [Rhizophagus irregularis]|uniref:Uncharacterized protein n=1 Tax=Rhizophagus irregularis TaxID=588596 RepID=A0A2I1GHM5_9GLOM|nr:hypothetical protein RhiirA4_420369 [Rhizophagus irregularis]
MSEEWSKSALRHYGHYGTLTPVVPWVGSSRIGCHSYCCSTTKKVLYYLGVFSKTGRIKVQDQVQIGLAKALGTIGIWICPMITGFRKWGGKKLIEHMDLVNQSSKSNKIKMLYVQII